MSETQDYIINVKVDGLETVVQMAASSSEKIMQAFALVQESLQLGAQQTQNTISNLLAQLDTATAQMSGLKDNSSAAENNSDSSGASKKSDDSSKKAENAKTTITAITSLMDTVGEASGGAVEKIMSIGASVLNLIPAFQAAGTAGATMGTMLNAALGVVGVIFTVITTIVNAITQAQEEAKKKMEEARKEIDSLRGNNVGAGNLVSEYETLSQKTVKTADDMQRMNDIRAELVDSYGFSVGAVDEEGRLISGNLDMMKTELDLSQELLKTKILQSKEAEKSSFNTAMTDQVNLNKNIKMNEDVEAIQKNFDPLTSFNIDTAQWINFGDIADMKQKLQDSQLEAKEALSNLFQIMVIAAENGGQELSESLQTALSEKLNTALNAALAGGTEFKEEDAEAIFNDITEKYNNISDNIDVDSSIESINALKEQLITAFSMDGMADTEGASDTITNIMNSILGTPDEQEIIGRVEQLNQRIMEGLASDEEMQEYDSLTATLGQNFVDAQDVINKAIASGIPVSEDAKSAVNNMAKAYSNSAKDLVKMAAQEKAQKMTLKDASSELRSVANSYENVSKAINDVANLKGAVQAIKNYNNATKKSEELSKDNANAKAYLADYYDVEESAIDGMLPSLEEDISMKETLALADFEVAKASAEMAKIQIQAMMAAGTISEEEGQRMVDALNGVILKMNQLSATKLTVDGTNVKGDTSGIDKVKLKGGGGGGGAKKNKALDREMEQLEHNKALDQVSTAEEIANLERILAKYAKTTDEKQNLSEKLYDLKKKLAQDELDYQKAMDQLTLREEIAAMDKMIATYKEGTTARRDLEKQRYEAQRELDRQDYDLKVYYGQLTLAQQEEQLKQMIGSYKEGVQDRIDLEKELYDLQQTIHQQNVDRLNGLSDAVVSALQARYQAQRDAEEKALNDSSQAWQDWGDKQVSAIQSQIDALDELTKQENDSEEEANKRRKIAMLEQQLMYEQDIYNKRKLQEELGKAQGELDDWLVQKDREKQKEALEKQIQNVNDKVGEEQKKIEGEIDARNEYYDNLMKDQNLQEEARRLLMQSGQDDIINLLKAYAPEYNATGQTLGDQLVDGFLKKVGNIDEWFAGLTSGLTTYKDQLSLVATGAANRFYTIPEYGRARADDIQYVETQDVKTVGPTMNVYFTDAKQSPAEIRRELERLLEQMSQM